MKITLVFFFFLCHIALYTQKMDSNYVRSSFNLSVKDKKIVTTSSQGNDLPIVMFYNGFKWKNVSKDSIPTIDMLDSKSVISRNNDHIFLTGFHYLWEYDGKNWIKHFIDDSLHGLREFEELIELPDSSLIVTAFSRFVSRIIGNTKLYDRVYHEVLRFKNGEFTTLKSRWTDKNTTVGFLTSFRKLKVQQNGNYSYYTTAEHPLEWGELVTYTPNGDIVRKEKNPDLSSFGYEKEYISFDDYVFDSKGSLWYVTENRQNFQFVGLVEVRENGEVYVYNENIGIPKSSNYHHSIEIDNDDNLWFNYTYRFISEPGKAPTLLQSLFKLHSNRTTLTEYKFEDLRDYSIWYNQNDSTEKFTFGTQFRLIKCHKGENSILITSDYPLIQFFPDNVPTKVVETPLNPIQLYPNPVQSGNKLIVKSSSLEGGNTPLSVVLRDVIGTKIQEELVFANGSQISINTNGLISGIYNVSVLNHNKTILQTSFVKE